MDRITLFIVVIVMALGAGGGYMLGARKVDALVAQLADIKTASEKAQAAAKAAKEAIDAGLNEQSARLRNEMAEIDRNASSRHAALSGYLNEVQKKLGALGQSRADVQERLARIGRDLDAATGERRAALEAERSRLQAQLDGLTAQMQSTACLQVPIDTGALRLAYSLQSKSE